MKGTCCKCNRYIKDQTQQYCCNQQEVYCMKCKTEEFGKFGQVRHKKSMIKEEQQVICKKCKQTFQAFEIQRGSQQCVSCLNLAYQKKQINRVRQYSLNNDFENKILCFLQGFCCLCLKKITQRYIYLEDGRRIDSICYECNQADIFLKLRTVAEKCRICDIILGDSLYIWTKIPVQNNLKPDICIECVQKKYYLRKEKVPLRTEINVYDRRQQKIKQVKKCNECGKTLCFVYISEGINLCTSCQLQKTQKQNRLPKSKIQFFRKTKSPENKQKLVCLQSQTRLKSQEQLIINNITKKEMCKDYDFNIRRQDRKIQKQQRKQDSLLNQQYKLKTTKPETYHLGDTCQETLKKNIISPQIYIKVSKVNESPMKKPCYFKKFNYFKDQAEKQKEQTYNKSNYQHQINSKNEAVAPRTQTFKRPSSKNNSFKDSKKVSNFQQLNKTSVNTFQLLRKTKINDQKHQYMRQKQK